MSQESTELVRRGYAALNDLDSDAMIAVCDPEVEFQSRITSIDDVTYHGHEGVRRFFERLRDSFQWVDIRTLEIVGEGDRIVVTNRFRARGALSGVDVEQRFYHALKLRSGRAIWWAFFDSKREALEAVGLEADRY
jgi:ketosteroid isomerase-like protein